MSTNSTHGSYRTTRELAQYEDERRRAVGAYRGNTPDERKHERTTGLTAKDGA